MSLRDFKILTFDVYGTLIDWESGMIAGLKPLTDRVNRPLTRDEILEAHAFHESTAQQWTPAKRYSELLATVHRRLAEEWGATVTWEECQAYGRSVRDWPTFPDSAEALAYLKQHYTLAVLTNCDNESFAHSHAKLGDVIDLVFTAEDIGSYKPADRNFDYLLAMLERHGLGKADILHVAESVFHDHAPADRYGLSNCWIYRRHDQEGFGATMNPGKLPKFAYRFNSMAELVAAHRVG